MTRLGPIDTWDVDAADGVVETAYGTVAVRPWHGVGFAVVFSLETRWNGDVLLVRENLRCDAEVREVCALVAGGEHPIRDITPPLLDETAAAMDAVRDPVADHWPCRFTVLYRPGEPIVINRGLGCPLDGVVAFCSELVAGAVTPVDTTSVW